VIEIPFSSKVFFTYSITCSVTAWGLMKMNAEFLTSAKSSTFPSILSKSRIFLMHSAAFRSSN
jgi:hypothetical protein